MAEISRVGQNKKGFINYNNHLTINHKVLPGKCFCSYITVTEIQKLPRISSKNNSDKLTWPAGVGILTESNGKNARREVSTAETTGRKKRKGKPILRFVSKMYLSDSGVTSGDNL